MSIYGAMMTGVSGLGAYSNALSVASANIANVNTVGYKTATSDFSTLLASATNGSNAGSATVVSNTGQYVAEQGLLQATSSATDLAISGSGFFVVTKDTGDTTARAYTRAGNFTADSNGYLKNSAGFYLLGWQLDSNGKVPSDRNDMAAINANSLTGKADATTDASAQINLQSSTTVNSAFTPTTTYAVPATSVASGDVTADFQRTINVYDSQGGQQPLQLSFVKSGANTWSYEVTYQGAATKLDSTATMFSGTLPTSGADASSILAYGDVTFNTDGTLASVSTKNAAGTSTTSSDGSMNITIPWLTSTSGLTTQTIKMNFGTLNSSTGLTQFDNSSNMASSTVNGALFGSLTGVTVDTDGIITAQFSNGLSQKVYKVPLATFANPDGLTQITGNAYQTSYASGSPTISEAQLGNAGSLQSKNLEGSTVDLATEFTDLITTQRAYSAASRIVTTASSMLDDLLQMAR